MLVRPQRARRRLGCRAYEDDGGASWRRVRPERIEDLHHERRAGDLDGRLCEDRSDQRAPRDLGVRRPDGHARRPDREAPRQDGAAVDRHLGLRPDRRRRARREPHRRGGRRVQDRDEDARLHAAGNGCRGRRSRAGGVRAGRRVREGARHVRRADRDAPGGQLPHRGHGDRDRGCTPSRLAVGMAARPGRARDAAVVVREAVRGRHGDEGDDRRRAGLRRLRVHQGVPGREADA